MASKPFNIRWISTGSQQYWKINYSIVLQTTSTNNKIKTRIKFNFSFYYPRKAVYNTIHIFQFVLLTFYCTVSLSALFTIFVQMKIFLLTVYQWRNALFTFLKDFKCWNILKLGLIKLNIANSTRYSGQNLSVPN